MKIIPVEQNTPEWLLARVGVITASSMDKIITPKTRKPSASLRTLAYRMIAEEVIGAPLDDGSSAFMERGGLLEQEARAWFEMEFDVDVQRVGLCVTDDGRVGCSPDGLVGHDAGLEIKCPAAHTHVSYLLGDLAPEYYCQIQGSLLVTGRERWHFLSYCPGFPVVCVPVPRDEGMIAALEEGIGELLHLLRTFREQMGIEERAVKQLAEYGLIGDSEAPF